MSDAEFSRFSALIAERTGIRLSKTKRTHIESRMQRRAAELGLPDVGAYLRDAFSTDQMAAERDYLIHLATTNKTDFFREKAHYDLLGSTLVPALLAARRDAGRPRLKVWSAAASNGAEAYTAAIVLAEVAAKSVNFDFAVLGTDVSAVMVEEATRAVYPAAMIEPVPETLKWRYFLAGRKTGAMPLVRVAPELRRHVRFCRLNLVDPAYPLDRDVDVAFLRNVLIYFDRQTQSAVVRRVASHLRSSGYLILGHTEAVIGGGLGFEQIGPGVFRVP